MPNPALQPTRSAPGLFLRDAAPQRPEGASIAASSTRERDGNSELGTDPSARADSTIIAAEMRLAPPRAETNKPSRRPWRISTAAA